MSVESIFRDNLTVRREHAQRGQPLPASDAALPAAITRAASAQTYYTVRWLVDRGRVTNAFRTYAYFRWLDDALDGATMSGTERHAVVTRQQGLIDALYRGAEPRDLSPQEAMLAELVRSDPNPKNGLHTYIRRMMDVMSFDAERRGELVSAQELDDYSLALATAVTEAMHYFIGHDAYAPFGEARYHAVIAAHITHMLRDTHEDTAAGYFNIPREVLQAGGIGAADFASLPYRAWVKSRVELARAYFASGREQLARVESKRCRLAGYAYMARFEGVLDAIERDGYLLRADYHECKSLKAYALAVANGLFHRHGHG